MKISNLEIKKYLIWLLLNNYMREIKYSKDHEWVYQEDEIATVGITNYAQESLGDIVFIELPSVG